MKELIVNAVISETIFSSPSEEMWDTAVRHEFEGNKMDNPLRV